MYSTLVVIALGRLGVFILDEKITFVLDKKLTVSIEFNNEDQKRQLIQHLKTYNFTEISTVLNLINWAQARNMRVEATVKGWGIESMAFRFLLYTKRKFPQAHPSPVRWPWKR